MSLFSWKSKAIDKDTTFSIIVLRKILTVKAKALSMVFCIKESGSWVWVIENRKHKNLSTFSSNTGDVLAFSELINNSCTRPENGHRKIRIYKIFDTYQLALKISQKSRKMAAI